MHKIINTHACMHACMHVVVEPLRVEEADEQQRQQSRLFLIAYGVFLICISRCFRQTADRFYKIMNGVVIVVIDAPSDQFRCICKIPGHNFVDFQT